MRGSEVHLVVQSVRCHSFHSLLWPDSSTWIKKHKLLEHGSKLERTLQRLDNFGFHLCFDLYMLSCSYISGTLFSQNREKA